MPAKDADNEKSDVPVFNHAMLALEALPIALLNLKGERFLFTRGLQAHVAQTRYGY